DAFHRRYPLDACNILDARIRAPELYAIHAVSSLGRTRGSGSIHSRTAWLRGVAGGAAELASGDAAGVVCFSARTGLASARPRNRLLPEPSDDRAVHARRNRFRRGMASQSGRESIGD